MSLRPTVLERAFELARGGKHGSIGDLMLALQAEGYDNIRGQMTGSSLRAQLKRAIDLAAARTATSPPD